MAISRIGSATGITSATLPAHQTNDLIVIFAFRDGSNTAASLPAGYTQIDTGGSNTCAMIAGYKVAASSSETSGTWTNATGLIAVVYRGAKTSGPIGGSNRAGNATGTLNYPTIATMTSTAGGSWVVGAAGHKSVDTAVDTAPAGMTSVTTYLDATNEVAFNDTNAGVTGWSSTNVALGGTAAGWQSIVFEIVKAPDVCPVTTSAVTLTGSSIALKVKRKAYVGFAGTNIISPTTESNTGSGQYTYNNITTTASQTDNLGQSNATKVTETAVTNYHQLIVSSSVTTKPASAVTVRFASKVKPLNQNYIGFALYDLTFSNSLRYVFDISTGTMTSNESYGSALTAPTAPTITDVGNGFYEIAVYCTINTAETSYYAQISPLKASTGYVDNPLGDVTKGFYILDTTIWNFSPVSVTTTGATNIILRTTLPVTSAGVALTGSNVNFARTRRLVTSTAPVTLTGSSIALRATRKLTVSTTTVILAASSVSLSRNRRLVTSTATVTLTPGSISMSRTRRLIVSSSPVTLNGTQVRFILNFISSHDSTQKRRNRGLAIGWNPW